jgi:hypothetical protein
VTAFFRNLKKTCTTSSAMSDAAASPSDRRQHARTQLTIGAAGALLSIFAHLFLPKSPTQSFLESVSNLQGNGSQFAWMHFVLSYFMQVVVFVGMLLFAFYLRGPRARIFALIAGGAIPELFIFHWLK